jgi:hypothetical protein
LNEAFQKFPTPLAAIAVLPAPGIRAHSALYELAEYGLFKIAFSRVIFDDAPLLVMVVEDDEDVVSAAPVYA